MDGLGESLISGRQRKCAARKAKRTTSPFRLFFLRISLRYLHEELFKAFAAFRHLQNCG